MAVTAIGRVEELAHAVGVSRSSLEKRFPARLGATIIETIRDQRLKRAQTLMIETSMLIKEIAEEIGVHPSTVSRAVSSKYAHTPQGVFELRYFFSEAVQGPGGGGRLPRDDALSR